MARKNIPQTVISDNAKVFISASKTLYDISNHITVQNFMSEFKIVWKFIPARAAWMGGFYERLIGMTKQMLKKILGKELVIQADLLTFIAEIECRINNRPLYYVSNDLDDPSPLSPSQLMYGFKPDTIPSTVDRLDLEDLDFLNPESMRLRLGRQQKVLDLFWKRWSEEYLTGLREFHVDKSNGMKLLRVGDVVLVHSDKNRVYWNLGLISELFRGKDGVVRSVKLKVKNEFIVRPVTKCFPLELNCEAVAVKNLNADLDRPLRSAAVKARKAIIQQMEMM